MLRLWFINLFREVLAQELLSIHTLLGEVLMNQAKILESVEKKDIETLAENEVRAHDGSAMQQTQTQERAISSTRPSWPRMKRYLEERDARRVIEERKDSFDNRNAAGIANRFNEEAAKLEAYWRNKSVKE